MSAERHGLHNLFRLSRGLDGGYLVKWPRMDKEILPSTPRAHRLHRLSVR